MIGRKSTLMLAASAMTLSWIGSVATGRAAETTDVAQADANGRLEEIVVTARKREEPSQKIPLAISALDENALKQQQVNGLRDLQAAVPGFSEASAAADQFNGLFSLRGISTLNVSQNLDPSVGVYVDGVYQGFSGANLRQAYDVSRIEVVKGPQGTLYGRNTTGGAINIVHNLPTDTFEGWIKAGAGNHGMFETAGMVNIPFVPGKVQFRLAGGYLEHDGYGHNTFNGREQNDLKQANLLAALRFTPTDQLEIIARGFWDDGRSSGGPGLPTAMVFGSAANVEAAAELFGFPVLNAFFNLASGGLVTLNPTTLAADFAALPGSLAAAQQAYLAQLSANYQDSNLNTLQSNKAYKTAGSLTVNYDFNDSLRLKSISGVVRSKRYLAQDLDGSSFALASAIQDTAELQYTQEVQLSGNTLNDRLKYTAGIFYFSKSAKDHQSGAFFPVLGVVPPSNFPVHASGNSFSAYGQATFALTSQVNVTGGVRWSEETKRSIDHFNSFDQTAKFHNISYLGEIDYSPVEDVMVYAKTSRGFRGGGLQESAPTGSSFDQESVTDYEVGVKSEFFEHRLRVNADIYHENYENLQQTVFLTNAVGSLINAVINAGKAKVDGAELQVLAVPVKNLTLGAQGAYTYPSYDSFIAGALGNVPNTPFANVQRYSYTVLGDYMVPMEVGDLRLHVDWHWRSKTRFNPLPTIAPEGNGTTFQNPYGILNARASLELKQTDIELAIWGRNLLNEQYFTFISDFAGTPIPNTGFGFVYANTVAEPRTFGVEATYRF